MRLLDVCRSLLLAFTAQCAIAADKQTNSAWLDEVFKPPQFDPTTPKTVTALQGRTAHLHCKVKRLNNKTVSWIRSRDLQILTTGTQTYVHDPRFQVARDSSRHDWTLMIKFAQPKDSGLYECQVSTQPLISYAVQLDVVVPEVRILNPEKVFLDAGSLLNLTCTVSNSPQPPSHVFWYHDKQAVGGGAARGGRVHVRTDPDHVTVSQLLITDAIASDSGLYVCGPSVGSPASIQVHVLTGEKPAAMHTSGSFRDVGALGYSSMMTISIVLMRLI